MLDINTIKICECSDKHISCISPKDWVKAQVVVWRFSYEGRDIRDKKIHPATYPIALANKAISLFTHRGELVADPFCGSGTTLVAAQDLLRSAVGFDLQQKYVDLAMDRLRPPDMFHPEVRQLAVCDDGLSAPNYLPNESIKLILTSPPYANMLSVKRGNKSRDSRLRDNGQLGKVESYSPDPRDLGNMGIAAFGAAMTRIFKALFPLVRPKGHCLVNVSDLYIGGERVLIHVETINALTAAGFRLKNIVIWDKTNILNGVGIFGYPSNFLAMGAFEYLLHFEKS